MTLLQVFKDFASGTSIVGLKYLVQPQLSVVWRVFWAVIILFALIFAGIELNKTVVCKFGLTLTKPFLYSTYPYLQLFCKVHHIFWSTTFLVLQTIIGIFPSFFDLKLLYLTLNYVTGQKIWQTL